MKLNTKQLREIEIISNEIKDILEESRLLGEEITEITFSLEDSPALLEYIDDDETGERENAIIQLILEMAEVNVHVTELEEIEELDGLYESVLYDDEYPYDPLVDYDYIHPHIVKKVISSLTSNILSDDVFSISIAESLLNGVYVTNNEKEQSLLEIMATTDNCLLLNEIDYQKLMELKNNYTTLFDLLTSNNKKAIKLMGEIYLFQYLDSESILLKNSAMKQLAIFWNAIDETTVILVPPAAQYSDLIEMKRLTILERNELK